MAETRPTLKRTDHDPRFLPYLGNHHDFLPEATEMWGGGVRIAQHLGKPLTPALWQDIVGRFCAHHLLVYPKGWTMWCMGWGAGTVIVFLDENELVKDLEVYPEHRWPPNPNAGPLVGHS